MNAADSELADLELDLVSYNFSVAKLMIERGDVNI